MTAPGLGNYVEALVRKGGAEFQVVLQQYRFCSIWILGSAEILESKMHVCSLLTKCMINVELSNSG